MLSKFSLDLPTGDVTLSFDVADGEERPAALIAFTDREVNVSYDGAVKPLGASVATESTSPSATGSQSGAMRMKLCRWTGFICFIGLALHWP